MLCEPAPCRGFLTGCRRPKTEIFAEIRVAGASDRAFVPQAFAANCRGDRRGGGWAMLGGVGRRESRVPSREVKAVAFLRFFVFIRSSSRPAMQKFLRAGWGWRAGD